MNILDAAVKAFNAKQKKILSRLWAIGYKDRGHGHGDYAVIVKSNGELVVECPTEAIASHIVELHNAAAQASRRGDNTAPSKKSKR